MSAGWRRPGCDEGTTLIELSVGMALMVVFMTIFTSAIVSMFASTNKTQAVVNSSTQLKSAFDRLDRQVRYASLIDQPTDTTYWSVAFQTDDPTSTTCRQLTIRPFGNDTTPDLVERTWTMSVNSDGSLSAPGQVSQSLLATKVVVGATPFEVSTPTAGAGQPLHQQLRVQLGALDGTGKSQAKSATDVGFTALNSTTPSAARWSGSVGSVCAQTETP